MTKVYHRVKGVWYNILRKLKANQYKLKNLVTNLEEIITYVPEEWMTELDYIASVKRYSNNKEAYKTLLEINNSKDHNSIHRAFKESDEWFRPNWNILGNEELIIMMQVGTVVKTEKPDVVKIRFTDPYIQMYNNKCIKSGMPTCVISNQVDIYATDIELVYNWLDMHEDKNKVVTYQKCLITKEGTPLSKIRTVEKKVEVIKIKEIPKIIKQEIKVGITKEHIEKKYKDFIRKVHKENNEFTANNIEVALKTFVDSIIIT